jgi:hypothetical protein
MSGNTLSPVVSIAIAGTLTFLVVAVSLYKRNLIQDNFADFQNILPAMSKPNLYWFVDSETNSRRWWDFGARNSNLPNRGYLQVSLEVLQRTQGEDFSIVTLVGREAVLELFPNVDTKVTRLPPALWRRWVIANICNKYGGLVIDANSTLCLGPSFYPAIKDVDTAVFGTHPDEPRVSTATAVAPGPSPYVGWAKVPNTASWTYAAKEINDLFQRGPQAWSAAVARRQELYVWEHQKDLGTKVIREADGGRLPNGRPRDLEDLFGRLSDDENDPKSAVLPNAIFMSWDGDQLVRRFEFNWFCALTANDVKNTDTLWTKLAGY